MNLIFKSLLFIPLLLSCNRSNGIQIISDEFNRVMTINTPSDIKITNKDLTHGQQWEFGTGLSDNISIRDIKIFDIEYPQYLDADCKNPEKPWPFPCSINYTNFYTKIAQNINNKQSIQSENIILHYDNDLNNDYLFYDQQCIGEPICNNRIYISYDNKIFTEIVIQYLINTPSDEVNKYFNNLNITNI